MARGQHEDDPTGEVGEQRRGDLFDGSVPGEPDEVDSADRLAARRRTRLLRQRIVFAVVVLVVLGAGTAGALSYTGRWTPGKPAATAAPAPAPSCAVAAPPPLLPPAQVSVSVLNGTTRRGLAGTVAAELRTRGFVVTRTANADTAAGPVSASVRYPVALLAQARTAAARVPGAQLAEDPALTGVEVVLGDGYAQLLAEDALVAPDPPAPAPAPGC